MSCLDCAEGTCQKPAGHTSGSGLGVLQRIQEVLGEYFAQVRRDGYLVDGVDAEEAAAAVMASLGSWDVLMGILDEHYPADVFPTMEDRENRDPGPRIVSLVRQLDVHRKFVAALIADTDRHPSGVCPVCSYLWSECTCGVTERES